MTPITILLDLKSAEATAKLNDFISNAESGLKHLATQVIGAYLGFEGIKHFAENLIHAAEAVEKLGQEAQKIGMPVDQLSETEMLAKMAGTNVEGLGLAMRGLAKSAYDADDPTSKSALALRALGVSVRDSSGAMLSEQQILLRLSDAFHAMPDGIEKVRIANELLGKSGQQLIPLLNKGSEEIRKSQEEARSFGLTVGPEFAGNAEHFSENLIRIHSAFDGMWRKLAEALLPELNRLTDWVVSFIKDSGTLMAVVATLVDLYATFASAVSGVVFAFDALGSFMGTFAGTLAATGDPLQAWSAAADQFGEKADRLNARLEKLARLSESVFKTAPASNEASAQDDPIDRALRAKAAMAETLKHIDNQIAESKLFATTAENDNYMSPAARLKVTNTELEIQIKLLQKRNEAIGKAAAEGGITRDEKQSLTLADDQKIAALQKQIQPVTVVQNIRRQMQELVRAAGTMAQQIGAAFHDVIGGAINTISSNITALIMQTKTWGQALLSIGNNILTSIIEAIVRMGVQWVTTQIMIAVAGKAIAASSVAANAPIAAAQAAIWSAPATLATISSYGAAAATAPGFIATAEAIVAASSAIPRERGGPVAAGNMYLIGERGPELMIAGHDGFVVPNAQLSSVAGGLNAGNQTQVHLSFHGGEAAAEKWARSQDGQAFIVDTNRKNVKRITRT